MAVRRRTLTSSTHHVRVLRRAACDCDSDALVAAWQVTDLAAAAEAGLVEGVLVGVVDAGTSSSRVGVLLAAQAHLGRERCGQAEWERAGCHPHAALKNVDLGAARGRAAVGLIARETLARALARRPLVVLRHLHGAARRRAKKSVARLRRGMTMSNGQWRGAPQVTVQTTRMAGVPMAHIVAIDLIVGEPARRRLTVTRRARHACSLFFRQIRARDNVVN